MLHDLGWNTADAKQAQWTGNWFDPQRAGEGCQLTLEGDQSTWILTCYFHRDGEQLWLIGDSPRQQASLTFDPDQVERIPWGRIEVELVPFGSAEVEFLDCNNLVFRVDSAKQDFSGFEREMTRIVAADC